MKRLLPAFVLAFLFLAGRPLIAQQSAVELPEYTDQERWERLGMNASWWQAAFLELGKVNGMTPEEVGEFFADYYSQAWTGGRTAEGVLFYLHRNHMAWPGASVEVISSAPAVVTARFNRPMDTYIGADEAFGGHTADEVYAMRRAADVALADFLGATAEKESDNGDDILTLETQWEPINAGNDMRWARGAYLAWVNQLRLLDLQMKGGLTAREAGLENARLYAPGWAAQTPWALFRGMTWNGMTDPAQECEVLEASAEEVQARCRIHFAATVEGLSGYYDVTVEDVLESWRGFAEGIAEHLGMRWDETWNEEWRTFTISYR